MRRIRINRSRGDDRPVSYDGPHGPIKYVEPDDDSRTVVVANGSGGALEFGPASPGPFGDTLGWVGDTKVVIRYARWGSYEPGRHAFDVRFGDHEYVLVSRGRRRPRPQLERTDGSIFATYRRSGGAIVKRATAEEAMLVALIGGSGLTNLTLPQYWLPRH